MKIKYLPKNVFLDTNIFEENNYLQGSSIQNIFEYSKEGIISLFMTQISRWELKNRIYKNIEDAVEEQKKYYNSINKTRVLRNLKRYKNIIKPTLDISAASNEVFNQIENLIESCNVKFIDSNSVDCDNVFDLYFKRQPPFSKEQNKKHEFPDAFIIMTIDKWCELNSTKMIFVTKDKNFNGYKSNRIIFKNDLLELLSDITIYYDSIRSNKILPEIDRRVKYYEEELLIYVENYIEEKLKHDIEFKDYYNLKIYKLSLDNYKVTSIKPRFTDVTIFVNVQYSVDEFPNVVDIHKVFFAENIKPKRTTSKVLVACEFEFHLEKDNDIKLKKIYYDEPICLH